MITSSNIPDALATPGPEAFAVTVGDPDVISGDVQVSVVGELDMMTAIPLVAAMTTLGGSAAERLARPHRRTVTFDLTGLAFIDTAGVRALGESQRVLAAAGWQICRRGAQPQVRRLLTHSEANGWLPPCIP